MNNKAFERAKSAYGTGAYDDATMEFIFPQLRESEDERIRKEIIEVLRFVPSSMWEQAKTNYERCFSYLEKQKERKHYWKPTETDVALFNKAVTTNKTLTPTERGQLDIIRSKFGCCRASNCSGIVQKEQKPILEVFGFKVGDAVRLKDGDGRKHIIKSFEEVEGLHGPNFYHVEFEDDSARDSICPGKEYPNGYYTQMEKIDDAQKPTEWSKEDEEMYARIVRRYTDYEGVIMRTKEESVAAKMLDAMAQEEIWLKSLSSNLKKKNEDVAKLCSNEWSKEDEKMLNELITIMDGGKVTSGTYLSEYAHWLKSIRPQPHWKPSEEQMGALSWMLENARGNIDFDPLKELYEQLKKL